MENSAVQAMKPSGPSRAIKEASFAEAPTAHTKMFESHSFGAYMLRADATSRFFQQKCENKLYISRVIGLIPVSAGVTEEYIQEGTEIYSIKGQIFSVKYERELMKIKIAYTGMPEIITQLEEFVKTKNRLRGQLFQIVEDDMMFEIIKTPEADIKDVIMNEEHKADIIENTIYELTEMHRSNAIINHGPPGGGKTMLSRSLAKIAAQHNIGTCFLVKYMPFSKLGALIKEFLMPCLLLLEDVDNYAMDRENIRMGDERLSDLLSFMNGVDEENHQIVIVANTNHLARLDSAVAARPMRFNRKYLFGLPNDEQINKLIDLYFGVGVIPDTMKAELHDKGYTGSHIEQIKRTADRMVKREGISYEQSFKRATDRVFEHFKPRNDANRRM